MDEALIIILSNALAAKVRKRLEAEKKESLTKEEISDYLLKTAIEMAKDLRDFNSIKN